MECVGGEQSDEQKKKKRAAANKTTKEEDITIVQGCISKDLEIYVEKLSGDFVISKKTRDGVKKNVRLPRDVVQRVST